jgi:hypothetical protein
MSNEGKTRSDVLAHLSGSAAACAGLRGAKRGEGLAPQTPRRTFRSDLPRKLVHSGRRSAR